MGDPTKPDAILFTGHFKAGRNFAARLNAALDKLEPILGVPKAHISEIGGGRYFCRAAHADKLLFEDGHELARQPRYTWEDGPDGLKFGTLVPEARGEDSP